MRLNQAARTRVRHERLRRQWGLRTAAERAGISVGAWRRIEEGDESSLRSLVAIVDALGWPTSDVDALSAQDYEPGEEEQPPPDPTDPGGLAQEVAELREQVDELNGLLRAALSGDTSRLFLDEGDGTDRPQPPPVDPDDVA